MRLSPAAALAIVLAVAGCGGSTSAAHHSPTPSSGRASPSAGSETGSTFPSPTPGGAAAVPPVSISCSSQVPPSHQLILVNVRGVNGVVVRDITDINHPVSRCTFSGGSHFRFVSGNKVSYIVTASGDLGAAGALYLANLGTAASSLVRSWSYGGYASWVYNWSPDGLSLTYLDSQTTGVTWHLLSAAGDRTLSSLGTVVPRGGNPDEDDAMVGFSADGKYVAAEQTFTAGKGGPSSSSPPVQVIRVADGSLAYSRTDGTMAAWAGAGAKFYFRTTAGVQAWSASGGVTTVAAGLSWSRPWASADGSRMAYSTVDTSGNHHGSALDLTTGAIHALSPQPRVGAAFITSALVWYAGESICTTTTPCGLGGPPLTGTTYIYDLGGDVESQSIDTAFYDAWPHVVGVS
jgi:hypothetical protein